MGKPGGGWSGGSTSAWRILRRTVLLRDGGRCQLRTSPKCSGDATHVHHKYGISVSGLLAPLDDLEAACRTCNLVTGDPTKRGEPAAQSPGWLADL
jgi:5-methylcytosine-specific restriction endonuclease McrA